MVLSPKLRQAPATPAAARTSGLLPFRMAHGQRVDLHYCLSPSASTHQSLIKVTNLPSTSFPSPNLLLIAGRTRAHDCFLVLFIFLSTALHFSPSEIPHFLRVISAECSVSQPGLTSLSFSPSFSPNCLFLCRLLRRRRRRRHCTLPHNTTQPRGLDAPGAEPTAPRRNKPGNPPINNHRQPAARVPKIHHE